MSQPRCQSCGMPLSRDEQGGGTEADGTKSALFCSHCYQSGQFTSPGMTVGQMQDLVRGKLKAMHIPGFLGYFFVKGIPKLRRWSGSE